MSNTTPPLRELIGQFLKKKRKEQNITLRELSLLIYNNEGSASNLGNVENGKVSTDINTLEKISLALGINLSETFNQI